MASATCPGEAEPEGLGVGVGVRVPLGLGVPAGVQLLVGVAPSMMKDAETPGVDVGHPRPAAPGLEVTCA